MNNIYTVGPYGFLFGGLLFAASANAATAASTATDHASFELGQATSSSSAPWHKRFMYIASFSYDKESISGSFSDQDDDPNIYLNVPNLDFTMDAPTLSLQMNGKVLANTLLQFGITAKTMDSSSNVPLTLGSSIGSSDLGGGSIRTNGDGDSFSFDTSLTYSATPMLSLGFGIFGEEYDIAFTDAYDVSYTSGLTISGNDRYKLSGTVYGANIFAMVEKKINATTISALYSYGNTRHSYTDSGIDSGKRDGVSFLDTYNEKYSETEKPHLFSANAEHYLAYNLSAGILLNVSKIKYNDGFSEQIQSIAARVKYLLTQNILITLNYEKYIQYESGYLADDLEYDAIGLKLSYNLKGKTSKRRMRKSRLIGSNRFGNVL